MTKRKTEPESNGSVSPASEPAVQDSSSPAATLSEAQRLAAMILECLAGVRTPPTAAEFLGISLPRYYQLEARALEGLVAALAPRPKGKQPSLENRVKALEKELETALRAAARQEALVRVTQRSLGLAALVKSPAQQSSANGKRRKPRRPMARAMRAAKTLRAKSESQPQTSEANAAGHPIAAGLQPTEPGGRAEEASV
jgi:hypothetical protein